MKILAERIDSHGKSAEKVEVELDRQGNTMWICILGERVNKFYAMPVADFENALVAADNEHRARRGER